MQTTKATKPKPVEINEHDTGILTALILISAVTFFSFYPCVKAGFINGYDDAAYVSNNPDIKSLSTKTIKKMFSSSYVGMYIPITMLSYTVDYKLSGLNPHAFHTTNLMIHIANCLLVFWFILIITERNVPASFLSAILFAVHPLRVESVAWIAERKDVLCAFFFLGSLISYLFYKKYQHQDYTGGAQLASIVQSRIHDIYKSVYFPEPAGVKTGQNKLILPALKQKLGHFFIGTLKLGFYSLYKLFDIKKHFFLPQNRHDAATANLLPLACYYLSMALFVMSALSKPMSVSLPLVMILVDLFLYSKTKLKEKLPFFAISLAVAVIAVATQVASHATEITKNSNLVMNLFVASHGVLFYLYKMALPFKLSLVYPYPDSLSLKYYISPLILFVLAGLVYMAGRKHRAVLFGSIFFLIALLPVLQIFHIGSMAAADRYTYIPSIGISFMVGLGIARLYEALKQKILTLRRPGRETEQKLPFPARLFVYSALAAMILTLSALTWNRSTLWGNPLLLWKDVTDKYSFVTIAYVEIGALYYANSEFQKSIDCFNNALKIAKANDFNIPSIYYNRGLAYSHMHQYKNAVDDYTLAIKTHSLSPDLSLANVFFDRANAYQILGMVKKAEINYSASLLISSKSKPNPSLKIHINQLGS